MPQNKPTSEMINCIQACLNCSDICLRTSRHCLGMGGEHASPEHQTLLQDCADICATAARFMSRTSNRHNQICRECSEICQACADDCARLSGGDETMDECAQVCRTCAQSCEHMASAGV